MSNQFEGHQAWGQAFLKTVNADGALTKPSSLFGVAVIWWGDVPTLWHFWISADLTVVAQERGIECDHRVSSCLMQKERSRASGIFSTTAMTLVTNQVTIIVVKAS